MILSMLLSAEVVSAQGWEDSFDGKTLNARWMWRAPVTGPTFSLQERPGWLRVRLPERADGFNHWKEPKPVDEAPQLRTTAPPGDWELEARLHLQQFDAEGHFLTGLVVGISDQLLLTFGPVQAPRLPGGPKALEAWLEPTGLSGFYKTPGEARELRLRLIRTGRLCRAQLCRGGEEWVEVGSYLLPATPRFVGLIGKTFSARSPIVFDVDYVRLTPIAGPTPAGRRALVGIGGEYPMGYRGLLARLGLPHEVLLDHQLADVDVLRRYDLILVGEGRSGVADRSREALTRYVRDGGTLLVDTRAFPSVSAMVSQTTRDKDTPDILVGGEGNPLLPLLGKVTRLHAGEGVTHLEPASTSGLQVLARFDGHLVPGGKPHPVEGYTGTPALWAMPMGAGLVVSSCAGIGAALSWGPTLDPLAEALIQLLGKGRLEPQLIQEGARFGRKQLGPLGENSETAESVSAATSEPEFARPRLSAPQQPLPREASLLEEDTGAEFNVSGVYHSKRGPARLLLNYWNPRFLVTVSFEPTRARLNRTENGRVASTTEMLLPGTGDLPFLLQERRDRIVLIAGANRVAISAKGLWEGKLASVGPALDDLRCQPVAPVFFSDDFVRGEDEQGDWEVAAGQWSARTTGDPKMGANPFSCSAQSNGTGLSVAGRPFWDNYTFDVSVRPAEGGAVGQAFYYKDGNNHLLFRARVGDSPLTEKNGFEIVRVEAGEEHVLAQRAGGLVKGHWYRLSVQVQDDGVSAAVDGQQVATARDTTFPGGRIALYVRDGQVEFDDVLVRGLQVPQSATELDGGVPRFAGTLDRDTWAGTALQWRADPGVPGRFWRNGRLYGDFDLTFRCNLRDTDATANASPRPGPARMSLLLAADEGGARVSYSLALWPTGVAARSPKGAAGQTYDVELTQHGKTVGRCSITSGERPALTLRRTGAILRAFVDGKQVLECRMQEAPGQLPRLGFLSQGFRPRLSGLRLRAANVLDYCFDRAPTDWWVASGAWDLAVRWPCTPEWSWFTGESRQVAAIWHKSQFNGDALLDLHVGPRTVDHGDGSPREICRAFNPVLCGDGQNVRSGYSFAVGVDKNGAGAMLARNGEVVARNSAFRFLTDAHNQWINVRAEKQGTRVALWVGDQKVLAFDDPNPLAGGRIGIWTEDNAIMVPRVTIFHRDADVNRLSSP